MASKDRAQGGKAQAGDARGDDPHAGERSELLRQIEQEVAETAHWLGKDRLAPEVMAAIARVPRHAFVPRMEAASAYCNQPLPIGLGQTISQPYIVAVMTDQAGIGPGARRSEEHTSELQSLMRITSADFCLNKKIE